MRFLSSFLAGNKNHLSYLEIERTRETEKETESEIKTLKKPEIKKTPSPSHLEMAAPSSSSASSSSSALYPRGLTPGMRPQWDACIEEEAATREFAGAKAVLEREF